MTTMIALASLKLVFTPAGIYEYSRAKWKVQEQGEKQVPLYRKTFTAYFQ